MVKLVIIFGMLSIFLLPLVLGATLEGTVYNDELEPETDVLVELNTIPTQRQLVDGEYAFTVSPGTYTLYAQKGDLFVEEEITIVKEGTFHYDLFLLPDTSDATALWGDADIAYFDAEQKTDSRQIWSYVVAGLLLILLVIRMIRVRKKYGPLRRFRKHHQVESKKSIEEHKADLEQEPGHLEQVIVVLQKQGGRISQKQLRRELLHLSEAKVSLMLTELEHKGKIEKVKKGRGNVILLK